MILADMPALDAPKTREVLGFLGALGLEGKTLLLTDGKNDNVYLSSRNLKQVEVMPFGQESVYDVLWANTVIIERSAIDGVADDTETEAVEKKAAPKKKAAAKKAAPKKKAAAKKAAPKKKAAASKAEEAPEAEAAEAPADEAPAEAEVAADETEEKTDA